MENNDILLAHGKIELGTRLIAKLDEQRAVPGVEKIQRKIRQEMKFLSKVVKNGTLKFNHVQCSNLTQYEFLVSILLQQDGVLHVDCGFAMTDRPNPLRVDIVSEHGRKWIKAIARNSKSLSDSAKGAASYGARSILDQAKEYVEASRQHLCMFQRPRIVFYFCHTIERELLNELNAIGVETASLTQSFSTGRKEYNDNEANLCTLNLDITTMLALISNQSNGSCNWTFCESILTEQAEKERQTPVKPPLEQLFIGKRLICCETAYRSFLEIVSLLAGERERQRATILMERIEILPDVDTITEQLSDIRLSGKINQRSLKIFAFGIQMRALTVTSNRAFVRSAKMQGIDIPVYTHQARALTEAKELTATLRID